MHLFSVLRLQEQGVCFYGSEVEVILFLHCFVGIFLDDLFLVLSVSLLYAKRTVCK